MRIVGGFQDTRTNEEDFAITPYLFAVYANEEIIQVYGVGICWGYWSVFVGVGFNLPVGFKRFLAQTYKPDSRL